MQTSNAGPHTHASYAGSFTQGVYASRVRRAAGLNLVPMIDIFTVLVTFLLMTAVFSRITILQLDLPSSTANPGYAPPAFRLEVIVRQEGFELTDGNKLIAAIPKVNGAYDFATLSQLALTLKREYPEANDASVLLEREIAYDYLIQVMDAIRSTEAPPADATLADDGGLDPRTDAPSTGGPKPARVALFGQIAVGEAP